jgi:eukaryotic-like serine/threonine-protein kinase
MKGKDGMVLLYVPAGKFIMGAVPEEAFAECQKYGSDCDMEMRWFEDEVPVHEVYLDGFWIDQTEVTNKMYAQCVADGGCPEPSNKGTYYYDKPEFQNYPVTFMKWDMAKTYCAWVGRRLPTEAEWEKAARGDDGRIYPWGNQAANEILLDPNKNANPFEVGKYPKSKSIYGALDMSGNVWQWVADWYSDTYYADSPASNPQGPEAGDYRVSRGGTIQLTAYYLPSSFRGWANPSVADHDDSFRCALSETQ